MLITQQKLTDKMKQIHGAIELIDEFTSDTPTKESTRRVSLGLYSLQLARLHSESILVLLSKDHPASAFCLARAPFESYVRAIWTIEIASDNEINNILDFNDKQFPKLRKAVSDISKNGSNHASWINLAYKKSPILHEWAHGGKRFYPYHFDGTDIRPKYPTELQYDLLDTYITPILFRTSVAVLDELALSLDQRTAELGIADRLGQILDYRMRHDLY